MFTVVNCGVGSRNALTAPSIGCGYTKLPHHQIGTYQLEYEVVGPHQEDEAGRCHRKNSQSHQDEGACNKTKALSSSGFFPAGGNVLPVVTCGAETWTMTKKEEQAVLIFERKIFGRIYGPKYEDGEWKIRTNRGPEEMNKGENIVKWIKGQKISWLGHLERMEEDRMTKKIFTQELEGTMRRGRPRK